MNKLTLLADDLTGALDSGVFFSRLGSRVMIDGGDYTPQNAENLYGLLRGRGKRVDLWIITHAHEDHLDEVELSWRTPGYCAVSRNIRVLGDSAVHARITLNGAVSNETLHLESVYLKPGERTVEDDLTILPVRADHAAEKLLLSNSLTEGSSAWNI